SLRTGVRSVVAPPGANAFFARLMSVLVDAASAAGTANRALAMATATAAFTTRGIVLRGRGRASIVRIGSARATDRRSFRVDRRVAAGDAGAAPDGDRAARPRPRRQGHRGAPRGAPAPPAR